MAFEALSRNGDNRPTLADIKRVVYRLILVLGAASVLLEWSYGTLELPPSRALTLFQWIAFVALLSLGVATFVPHRAGRLPLQTIESLIACVIAVLLTTKFAIVLFAGKGPMPLAAVESWYWLLLGIWILSFLAYDLKRAMLQNVAVYLTVLLAHLLSVYLKAGGDVFFDQLPEIIASHLRFGITLALLAVLGNTKAQWMRIEREADALRRLAHIDPLTELPNRRRFTEILTEMLAAGDGPLSIIAFDLDSFKLINDRYGHVVGDQILQETAQLVKQSVRKHDTVYRWGGEEFLVICPNATLQEGLDIAERLRRAIEAYDFPKIHSITASFGVAERRPQENAEDLIARADKALYTAKAMGKNKVHADP